MAQHDLDIANGSGASVRADLNNALVALGSTMKGASAPSAAAAGMMWVDDDTPSSTDWTVNIYDGSDWSAMGRLDVTNNRFVPNGLFQLGSASAPGFAPAGDSDTGLWSPGANTLAMSTNSVERWRLTSAGAFGVGTTTPADVITASRADGNVAGLRAENLNVSGGYPQVVMYDIRGSTDVRKFAMRNLSGIVQFGVLNDAESSYTEWGRFSGSTFLLGTTALDGSANGITLAQGENSVIRVTNGSGSRVPIAFYRNGSTTAVGSISTTDSATTYNTSSDYRLKRDLETIAGDAAETLLRALKPYLGRFVNEAPDAPPRPMLLAHEYAEVVPHAVTGEKDGAMMQTAQYDPALPIIIAALTHALDRIAVLEAA